MADARALAITMLALSSPAAAQAFEVPEGCTPVATVHKDSCAVTHILDCGAGFEAHTRDASGRDVRQVYTKDWEWIDYSFDDAARFSKSGDAGGSFSREALIADGSFVPSGEYVFNTRVIRDHAYSLSGTTTLGDETVELGGEMFRKGRMYREFKSISREGGLVFDIEFLLSESRNLVIEGVWIRSTIGGEPEVINQDPRAIYWPGEPGFLAETSEFGCKG